MLRHLFNIDARFRAKCHFLVLDDIRIAYGSVILQYIIDPI